MESVSRSARCYYENRSVPCQPNVLPGTKAQLKCNNSYRRDSTLLSPSDTTTCNETGQWKPTPIQCVPGPLAINIHVNEIPIVLQTDVTNNNSTFIEILEDKVIIYTNKEIIINPDIDIRMNRKNINIIREY